MDHTLPVVDHEDRLPLLVIFVPCYLHFPLHERVDNPGRGRQTGHRSSRIGPEGQDHRWPFQARPPPGNAIFPRPKQSQDPVTLVPFFRQPFALKRVDGRYIRPRARNASV